MSYGKIEYNKEGLAMCEECGKYFHRPVFHAYMTHDMSAYQYKKKHGFETVRGICSKVSAEKSRKANKANYDLVVKKNLHEDGKGTRFVEGDKGRTGDMLSAETMRNLKKGVLKKGEHHKKR